MCPPHRVYGTTSFSFVPPRSEVWLARAELRQIKLPPDAGASRLIRLVPLFHIDIHHNDQQRGAVYRQDQYTAGLNPS